MFNVGTKKMNSFAVPVSGTPVLNATTKPEKKSSKGRKKKEFGVRAASATLARGTFGVRRTVLSKCAVSPGFLHTFSFLFVEWRSRG